MVQRWEINVTQGEFTNVHKGKDFSECGIIESDTDVTELV